MVNNIYSTGLISFAVLSHIKIDVLHPCSVITMSDQDPCNRRPKKSDKAKKTFDTNGGFSKKHVRIMEALALAKELTKVRK